MARINKCRYRSYLSLVNDFHRSQQLIINLMKLEYLLVSTVQFRVAQKNPS